MPTPQHDDEALAAEIRSAESFYVEAAVEAFRKRIKTEYFRLRGYALEGGEDTIQLGVTVTMGFNPGNRHVLVQSIPKFHPAPGADLVAVAIPARA
jgi:hypothetical protein